MAEKLSLLIGFRYYMMLVYRYARLSNKKREYSDCEKSCKKMASLLIILIYILSIQNHSSKNKKLKKIGKSSCKTYKTAQIFNKHDKN